MMANPQQQTAISLEDFRVLSQQAHEQDRILEYINGEPYDVPSNLRLHDCC